MNSSVTKQPLISVIVPVYNIIPYLPRCVESLRTQTYENLEILLIDDGSTDEMNDCRFDVFRASGNGGQCVNTTDSAVRLTHIPTGIVVSCQDEKSQLKNKDKALKVLRSRLYELEQQKAHDEEAAKRKSQIGTGDRSEKIRTYNYPQGRVTDHRIKLTLHKLDSIMNGDLDELIDSLTAADQAAKLSNMEEE